MARVRNLDNGVGDYSSSSRRGGSSRTPSDFVPSPDLVFSAFLNQFMASIQGRYDDSVLEEFQSLIDQMRLQYASTTEQRAYDESIRDEQRRYDKSVLDEQRQYDNPLAALSRLTGAGISRSAAIQLLSGAGDSGSALIGSGAIGAGSGAGLSLPMGISPSQIKANELQSALGITNTVFGALSSLVGLASFGLSIPSILTTIKSASAAAYMSAEEVAQYKNVTSFFGKIRELEERHSIPTQIFSKFKNVGELVDAIRKNTSPDSWSDYLSNMDLDLDGVDLSRFSDDWFSLVESPEFKSMVDSPLGYEMLNRQWHAMVDAGSYGTQIKQQLKSQELANLIAGIDFQKAGIELAHLDDQLDADLIASLNSIALQEYDMQLKEIEIESANEDLQFRKDTHDKRVSLVGLSVTQGEQAVRLSQYEINHAAREDYVEKDGFYIMKEARLAELQNMLIDQIIAKEVNDKTMQEQVEKLVRDKRTANNLAYLEMIDSEASAGFAERYPNLWRVVQICKEYKIFDNLHAIWNIVKDFVPGM